jgi:predicted dehydrogenase
MFKIAVIGCGHWGPHHIRNFSGLPGSTVVSAVDLDAGRLARISEMFPAVKTERDYSKALEDSNIDAVAIATPTDTHYQLVREALIAGKHVLCEKPLCEKSFQAEELIELARNRGLILMVGHVFLFNPGIVKIKEILDAGELGALHYLSAIRTNLGPIRKDVNAAYDLATHDISIFNWLLESQPESVSATGASFLQPGIEDVVFISLTYPRNVIANIRCSWLDPKKVRQITVVGNRKMVTWDDLDPNRPVAIYEKGANAKEDYTGYGEFLRISMWDGDVRLPKVQADEPLKIQDRYFLNAVQQGTLARSNGRFAVGVVKTLEAVSESLKSGGSRVRVSE